jgi:TolB-like protein
LVPATAHTTAAVKATPAVAAVPEKSVAVLPFLDMSEKQDEGYFSDGLSEELIDMLTKVPDLRVPARTSSFYIKGKQSTIKDIAATLRVAHVLERSVRKSGKTLRITAQLIHVESGYHVWSETFDREIDDIFKIQDEIAGAVFNALKVSLLRAEGTRAAPTASSEAYTLYLQARLPTLRGTVTDAAAAADYLQRAITAPVETGGEHRPVVQGTRTDRQDYRPRLRRRNASDRRSMSARASPSMRP